METNSRHRLIGCQGIAEFVDVAYIEAMPKTPQHIGDRLRQEMDRLGLTPTVVAERFGVKNPSVYDWLKFGRIAKKHIPGLVEMSGKSAEWWITGDENAVLPPVPSMGAPGLADRIKSVLDEAGGNISAVATAAGTTEAVVAGWLAGNTATIGVDEAVALQEKYGVNSVWLMLGKGRRTTAVRYNDEWNPIPVTGWRGIPVVGMAQLGDGGFWADVEYPVGHGDGFVDVPSKDKDAYALRCKGDSMRPRIKDGEFVVVEPNHDIEPGDEVLVKSKDGRVMVKEFLYKRGGRYHLASVNETHGNIAFSDEEIEKMHYVGWIAKPSAWRPD
ncbi:Peptidase S24-like [Paraburkholderia fungorum]|uniref:Peptidase S24-like n=1 Tax=Paraburkholderia fungorum TaxID=134537 RepID=A0A1H1GZK9_9BURK|nr:S24 family peptidase [Paraburkholderia fungorum]SDR18569.1 Peptidase S24-like [Paraburkholderia fungorum]